MSSTSKQIRDAILQAINENTELRELIESVPEQVAETVAEGVPVDTGTAQKSIEIKARRNAYKKLSTRRTRVGTVRSDDDFEKIMTLEFGRDATDDNGASPEFAMFRKAAQIWKDKDL